MSETCFEMQKRFTTPALIAEKDLYSIKFAVDPEEIKATQRLRYKVFNVEQGKGLDSANRNGIDCDEFDDYCLHLIVEKKDDSMPVGTYRINIGPMADCDIGFYSSREYAITGFDAIQRQVLEVGRSCVSPEYRNGTVVALLWAGISEVLARTKMRYLTGCVSLEDTRPEVAWAVYDYLCENGKLSGEVTAVPREGFDLPRPEQEKIDAIRNNRLEFRRALPPLLKGYLRIGAKICGPPAFDYEFGTSDFLILMDVFKLPGRYSKHFNVREMDF